MGTPGPATGSAFSFAEVFLQAIEMFFSGFWFFDNGHPADPFIAGDGGETVPGFE